MNTKSPPDLTDMFTPSSLWLSLMKAGFNCYFCLVVLSSTARLCVSTTISYKYTISPIPFVVNFSILYSVAELYECIDLYVDFAGVMCQWNICRFPYTILMDFWLWKSLGFCWAVSEALIDFGSSMELLGHLTFYKGDTYSLIESDLTF